MGELKEKKCFKCEHILSIDCFYKHKQMSDGYLNKCIECTKNDIKKNERKLREDPDWVAKERKRGRDKYHRLEYVGLFKPSTEDKRNTIKRYHQKFPEKALACKYTEIFLTKTIGFNLHHWSYNQEDWLDVIDLPIKEHHFLHRYIIYDQERMMYRKLDGTLLDSKNVHIEYFNECKIKYDY